MSIGNWLVGRGWPQGPVGARLVLALPGHGGRVGKGRDKPVPYGRNAGGALGRSVGWIALAFGIPFAVVMVASAAERPAPDLDAPVPTAKPGTALYHAQMCAQYLGPIPRASCSDAQIVPVTVDGVEVPWTKNRPSRFFEQPKTCDLRDTLSGGCQLGNGVARYQGTHRVGKHP